MSTVQCFSQIVTERLSAAAEEILDAFKVAIIQYEEEIDRQRKLLDLVLNPVIKQHRIVLPKQYAKIKKETHGQQINASLDQDYPETPQFTGESGAQESLDSDQDAQQTPFSEESPARDHQLLSNNNHEAESKDLDRDSIKLSLHSNTQTDVPQQHVCMEETVCTDENVDDKEMLSRVKEEEPQPPQITEEQEEPVTGQDEDQLRLKQETDAVMVTLTYDQGYPSEAELRSDRQLVFDNFNIAKRRTWKRKPTKTAKPKPATRKQINDSCSNKKYKPKGSDKKTFICAICGRDCKFKSKFDVHMRTHTGERPYTCKICGKGFRNNGGLFIHTKRHTGEKPHLCMVCGSRFLVISGLKRHMLIHTGERPFPCEVCGRNFRTTTDVKSHMRTHTGEKPYVCQTCGKGFSQGFVLKRHVINHHNGLTC